MSGSIIYFLFLIFIQIPTVRHHNTNFNTEKRQSHTRNNFEEEENWLGKDSTNSELRSRIRRQVYVIRCCGMASCWKSSNVGGHKSSKPLAFAKFISGGINVRCPLCPKGWQNNLNLGPGTGTIRVVCVGCPMDWLSLVNVDAVAAKTTKESKTTEEEVTDSTDGTDGTETDDDEKTTKATTSALKSSATTTKAGATTASTANATTKAGGLFGFLGR